MSRSYAFTERGHKVAREVGLQRHFQDKMPDFEDPTSSLVEVLAGDNPGVFGDEERNHYLEGPVKTAMNHLGMADEAHICVRGLNLRTGEGAWLNVNIPLEGTLFYEPAEFAKTDDPDQYVLSGLIGANAMSNDIRVPRMVERIHERLDHETFAQSLAFVGAYAVHEYQNYTDGRLGQRDPSFTVEERCERREIGVGGSFHGDFRMWERRATAGMAISPIGTVTEYSPTEKLYVAGYHSIEPTITADLIADEYIRRGREGALELVDELQDKTRAFMAVHIENGTRAAIPRFADYGGDRLGEIYALSSLRNAIRYEDEDLEKEVLINSSYLPQSTTNFTMVRTDKGVRFTNSTQGEPIPDTGIEVARAQYPELYRALLEQAMTASGRTSPDQHFSVVEHARRIINGEDEY